MKHGVVFPQTEFGNDVQAIKDYAQTAEGLGYDYLLVYDHVLGAHPSREPKLTGPYTYEHPFHEPMVFFGFLSAITTKLELVTGILILPQRQTALVAKQTAEVDVLSGGRLRLGIGIGWNYVEYDALGEEFRTRGRRVEEQIEVLRKLWTQPLVTHKGAHHVIDNAGINPLPIRRPIPVWFGGAAEPVLERAARIGDGWMPAGRPPDDRMKGYVDQLNWLSGGGRPRSQAVRHRSLDQHCRARQGRMAPPRRGVARPGGQPPGRGYDARRLRDPAGAHRRDPVLPGGAELVMRFGVTIPNNWGIADPRQVLAMGPLAESLGYDSVWVMDHLLNSGYIRERLDDRPYYHPLAHAVVPGGDHEARRAGHVRAGPALPQSRGAREVRREPGSDVRRARDSWAWAPAR